MKKQVQASSEEFSAISAITGITPFKAIPQKEVQPHDVNVDLCGTWKLLSALEQHGFSKQELKKILTSVAVQTGADIILDAE